MANFDKILLAHGGGGEEMGQLINEIIFGAFDNEILRQNNDSAVICVGGGGSLGAASLDANFGAGISADGAGANSNLGEKLGENSGANSASNSNLGENLGASFGENSGANLSANSSPNLTPNSNLPATTLTKIAFSTDSFVVSPHEFRGGDIGKIAACGTINDLAMCGAAARYISCALILEEGLEVALLRRVLASLAAECAAAGVAVVCGDTKVVPKGACDGIFINTSGIGEFWGQPLEVSRLKAGAKLILSGDIGRHGAVVLAAREGLETTLTSDCKALKGAVAALFAGGVAALAARDATRGGLSAVLNEWAAQSGLDIRVREEAIAVRDEVKGVCELFGFEPYELANEGTFVVAVEAADAERAAEILRGFDVGAAVIGEVVGGGGADFGGADFGGADFGAGVGVGAGDFDGDVGVGDAAGANSNLTASDKNSHRGRVILQTLYGGERFLEPPKGELLPRIC